MRQLTGVLASRIEVSPIYDNLMVGFNLARTTSENGVSCFTVKNVVEVTDFYGILLVTVVRMTVFSCDIVRPWLDSNQRPAD